MYRLAACLIFALTSGCATGYQARGIKGGYTDLDLGGGKYLVSFSGNGFTRRDTTQRYAVHRAKELCAEQEMDFEILQIGGDTSAHAIGSSTSNCASSYGYGYGTTNCRHNGPSTVNKHTTEVVVQCKKPDAKQASAGR